MDVNKFMKLNNNDMIQLLISLDSDDKKYTLKNEVFRNFLLNDFLLFSSVVDALGKDLNYLCDDNFADLIISKDVICISNLMMCDNDYINDFLSKPIIIDYLYDNIDEIKFFLNSKSLNMDFTKSFFNRLIPKDGTIIKYIVYFDKQNQNLILKDKSFTTLGEKLDYSINNFDGQLELLPHYLELYNQIKDDEFLICLQELSKKDLIMMISEYFFNLRPHELKLKVKNILEYIVNGGDCIIPSYKIKIYSLLLGFDQLSAEEIKQLYASLPTIDLEHDYSDITDACYNQLSNSLLKGNEFERLVDYDLSDLYKSKVYTLSGEPFFMLIHSTKFNREQEQIPDMSNRITYSCSVISDEHLLTYQDPSKNIVLGFDDFNINNVTGMYETNAFTEFESKRVPRLYSPKQLIENTMGFNEILYLDNDHSFRPSYIVCYDEIKSGDLESAKSFGNIPLVLIDTSAYEKKNNINRKK